MADEPKEEGGEEEKEKPKKKPLIIIAAGLVVVFLVGGGVFFFTKQTASKDKASGTEQTAEIEEEEEEGGASSGKIGPIFNLEPFVVNLSDPTEIRYLKISIKLELSAQKVSQELDTNMPIIRDSLLILLSSKDYAGVRTVEGKLELRDEILQRVNAVLEKRGSVRAAYFTDFVVQ